VRNIKIEYMSVTVRYSKKDEKYFKIWLIENSKTKQSFFSEIVKEKANITRQKYNIEENTN
jgi:hypothetical protein